MKKLIISFTAIVIAFIFIICSIGAYDNGTIGFGQFLIQTSISILVEWLSFKALTKN